MIGPYPCCCHVVGRAVVCIKIETASKTYVLIFAEMTKIDLNELSTKVTNGSYKLVAHTSAPLAHVGQNLKTLFIVTAKRYLELLVAATIIYVFRTKNRAKKIRFWCEKFKWSCGKLWKRWYLYKITSWSYQLFQAPSKIYIT